MLMIRLQRTGRKNQAAFRVRVVDSHKAAKAGTSVEILGSYSPHSNTFEVNKERVLYWMGQGAQLSDTVRNLLIAHKVIEGKKVNVLPKKSPIKSEQEAVEAPAEATTGEVTVASDETETPQAEEEVKSEEASATA